jgi:hypothetical protein
VKDPDIRVARTDGTTEVYANHAWRIVPGSMVDRPYPKGLDPDTLQGALALVDLASGRETVVDFHDDSFAGFSIGAMNE